MVILGSYDPADWRFNDIPLPPWNVRLFCKCRHVATTDHMGYISVSDLLVGRRYFKCLDLDEDFVV
jgi:hypothetical protein